MIHWRWPVSLAAGGRHGRSLLAKGRGLHGRSLLGGTYDDVAMRLSPNRELIYRSSRGGRLKGTKVGATWIVGDRELARFEQDQTERQRRP